MSIREKVLAAIPEIPTLPTSATQVLRLVRDPDAGIGEIMEAIEYDPTLTAEILRLANTAYFAGPRKIATLRDAGVLLGSQRILQLVMASSVLPITRQPLRGYDLPGGQLARQSMSMAIGAELLAGLAGRRPPNHTFTSGLLADIGKIVLGSFLEIDARPVLELAFDGGLSFEEAERAVLGIDHAEVGAALLEAWNVPDEVIQVVRWHHDPNRLEGDPFAGDLVHVASLLCASCGIGAGVDGLNYRPCSEALDRLGATRELLEHATCLMLVALDEIKHELPGFDGD